MEVGYSKYNNLSRDLILYIFSFYDLETLIDTVSLINNEHCKIVEEILKTYTFTKYDCNNGNWFRYNGHGNQNKNTLFLYKFLKLQVPTTKINSLHLSAPQNTIGWHSYLISVAMNCIKYKNLELFGTILINQLQFRRFNITLGKPSNWLEINSIKLLIKFTISAIEYNSLNIIDIIFDKIGLHFSNAFDSNKIEEVNFQNNMYYGIATKAIQFNNIDIMTYFASIYNYTNEQYINLLILCSDNQIIEASNQNGDTPSILLYILSKITDLSTITADNITEFINIALQNNMIYNIACLLSKISRKISIDNYKNILYYLINSKTIYEFPKSIISSNKIPMFKSIFEYIYTLYSRIHDVESIAASAASAASTSSAASTFSTNNITNITNITNTIKKSLLYKCFVMSINCNNIPNILYLKGKLILRCKTNNIIVLDYIKYIIVDCIKQTHNHPEYVKTESKIYDLFLNEIISLFTVEHITTIMNILSINNFSHETYEYFLNKFVTNTIFSKKNYINILKQNLIISFKNNNYNSLNEVLELNISKLILSKLIEAGETNHFNSPEYKNIFLDLIKKKNKISIELFLTNGFLITTDENITLNNKALLNAVKSKSMAIIRLLITHGGNISSNDYNVLHFALNHKTQNLAHFIKEKLQSDNKEQLYLEWEQNAVLKAKYLLL
jgi:hypothetical protein